MAEAAIFLLKTVLGILISFCLAFLFATGSRNTEKSPFCVCLRHHRLFSCARETVYSRIVRL